MPTPAAHAAWADAYRASVVSDCVTTQEKTFGIPGSDKLIAFCACLRTQYEQRYAQEEFAAHRAEYETKATTDGTTEACKAQYPPQ